MADRFRAELGITPKTAARIFRFERACGLISNLRPRHVRLVGISASRRNVGKRSSFHFFKTMNCHAMMMASGRQLRLWW